MGAWIQWILTGLAPLCLSVAMWCALIQIRGLRERAETAERAVQQIAEGQGVGMVAPLDEWRGEIRVPVAEGFLA